jgi:hypothetical protein
MKHGVFSKTALFPWEDGTEFQALHSDLQDEWQPSGALEEDAVFTILTCIWRKRRIFDKRNLEIVAALQEQEFVDLTTQPPPLFDTRLEKNKYSLANRPNSSRGQVRDRVAQLLGFSSALYGDLDERFLNLSISMLDKEFSTHLRQEVPKEKYPTTPEWVMAVKREVDEVMLPRVRAEMIGPVHLAAKAAAFLTADRIIADLTLEERLDAMIDRAIRRLAQGKMMKQVAGITEHQQHLPAVSLKIARPKYKRAKAKKPNN